MAQIVRLSEYRRQGASRRPAATTTTPPQATPHYFCLRCDTDQFKLYPGGTVHCAHCGALMRNIFILDKSSS